MSSRLINAVKSNKYENVIIDIRNFRRFLLLGWTGSGKSSTANNVLRKNICKVGHNIDSETEKCEEHALKFRCGQKDCVFYIVDTPGINDTSLEKRQKNWDEISNFIKDMPIDYTFWCHNFCEARMNVEEFVKQVQENLNVEGPKIKWSRLVVVITHAASKAKYSWGKDQAYNGPENYVKRKANMTKQIKAAFKTITNCEPPVVFIENDPDLTHKDDKGFQILPDGKAWLKEFWEQVINGDQMDVVASKMFSSAFLYEWDQHNNPCDLDKVELQVPNLKPGQKINRFSLKKTLEQFINDDPPVDDEEAYLLDNDNYEEKQEFLLTETVSIKSPHFVRKPKVDVPPPSLANSEENVFDPVVVTSNVEYKPLVEDSENGAMMTNGTETNVGEANVATSNSNVPEFCNTIDEPAFEPPVAQPTAVSPPTVLPQVVHPPPVQPAPQQPSMDLPKTDEEIAFVREQEEVATSAIRKIGVALGVIGTASAAAGGYSLVVAGSIAAAPVLAPIAVVAGAGALIVGGLMAIFG